MVMKFWVFVSESADRNSAMSVSNNKPSMQDSVPSEKTKQVANSANIDFRKGSRNSGIVELSVPAFNWTA